MSMLKKAHIFSLSLKQSLSLINSTPPFQWKLFWMILDNQRLLVCSRLVVELWNCFLWSQKRCVFHFCFFCLQVLYVPRHWWHYVESVDPITVSVNSWIELVRTQFLPKNDGSSATSDMKTFCYSELASKFSLRAVNNKLCCRNTSFSCCAD